MSKFEIPRTTYRTGLLQARAYRKLTEFMTAQLKKYDVTMMQWSLLGHVYEAGEQGIRSGDLAVMFNTETSLMTNTINILQKKKLVSRISEQEDKRAKRVIVTKKGRELVETAENEIKNNMKVWLQPVPKRQLVTYIQVIKKISEL